MIYKLTKVVKITEPENFDRSSIEGKNFDFMNHPEVGFNFCARSLSNGQYITTTAVTEVVECKNYITVRTKHTAYTFQPVADSTT